MPSSWLLTEPDLLVIWTYHPGPPFTFYTTFCYHGGRFAVLLPLKSLFYFFGCLFSKMLPCPPWLGERPTTSFLRCLRLLRCLLLRKTSWLSYLGQSHFWHLLPSQWDPELREKPWEDTAHKWLFLFQFLSLNEWWLVIQRFELLFYHF
jgi:hypothetical protein